MQIKNINVDQDFLWELPCNCKFMPYESFGDRHWKYNKLPNRKWYFVTAKYLNFALI